MIEEKAVELMNQLAIKLGVASEKIWEWSLLNVKVEIVEKLIFNLCFMLFCFIEYKIYQKYIKDNEEFDEDEIGNAIGVVLAFIFTLIGGMVFIANICNLPSLIINPEWSAMQSIISQLSTLK